MSRKRQPYHKLVKTTPNPSATKNSRGELPGVLLLLPESVWVGDGTAEDVLVASAMLEWVYIIVTCGQSLNQELCKCAQRASVVEVVVIVVRWTRWCKGAGGLRCRVLTCSKATTSRKCREPTQ